MRLIFTLEPPFGEVWIGFVGILVLLALGVISARTAGEFAIGALVLLVCLLLGAVVTYRRIRKQ